MVIPCGYSQFSFQKQRTQVCGCLYVSINICTFIFKDAICFHSKIKFRLNFFKLHYNLYF